MKIEQRIRLTALRPTHGETLDPRPRLDQQHGRNSACRHALMIAGVLAFVISLPQASGDEVHTLEFETAILPIVTAHCIECHGPAKRNADLSLASGAELLRGGETGDAVVAGKPDESLLWQMIRDDHMPPKEKPRLSAEQKERVRAWIAAGAATREAASAGTDITEDEIVPVLLLRCSACHGGRRAESGLDLRTKAGILKGGKSGPAAIPGDSASSRLVQRVHAEEMPPRRQLVAVSVKPMEDTELKLIKAWIDAGMPEAARPTEMRSGHAEQSGHGARMEKTAEVSDSDRDFWSFRSPKKTPLPVESAPRAVNAIDVFVTSRLRAAGLEPSPEAPRATLFRRLSFDLLGLPPQPEDVAEFVVDPSPDAYEAAVERMLASPRYGERWARHWLDVAGYADSEGAQNEDRVRPDMWRYRDYVIQSFNVDKSYDRFLHEQLAGDELADYEHATEITDEISDNLVATGFLRTAPDRTFANITNFVPDRLEVIADEMQILGSAVLGLTLHCARCHSHKFDPIPQTDYYRLTAVFKDALDEHDWLGPAARRLNQVTTRERRDWEAAEQLISDRLKPLQERLKAETDEDAKKRLSDEVKQLESTRRPEPLIRALWSRGDPSPAFLLKRGNYLTPGRRVDPGVPAVLAGDASDFTVRPPWPGAKSTGRRLAFARWLTRPDHPLTARVMVNRLWMHHFGAGLVTTPANFGKTGSPPSHPELLDWLAVEFVKSGWSIKQMHWLMVNSATYRQSSQVTPEMSARDPDNRWLSRMPLRRVEAEVLRDSLLFVAGRLDVTPFGPPDDVDVRDDGLVTAKAGAGGARRSVYVLHRRTKLPTILETFDSPQMGPNCIERGVSTVAPQALHLLNNAAVHGLAADFARRVMADCEAVAANATIDDARHAAWVRRAHELAEGTVPEARELDESLTLFQSIVDRWKAEINGREVSQSAGAVNDTSAQQEAEAKALANYCHAVMNSAAFVFVD